VRGGCASSGRQRRAYLLCAASVVFVCLGVCVCCILSVCVCVCACVCAGNIAIDPRMAYIVVPYTQQPRIENSFVLRVFSEADVCAAATAAVAARAAAGAAVLTTCRYMCTCLQLTVATVPDPYSLQVRGVWSEDSAGYVAVVGARVRVDLE
jgi:hypothetical protein